MAAVDFALLREITDGDKEMEAELFSLFTEAAEESLRCLDNSLTDGETWKKMAHAFKGSSANLGAVRLSELCRQAQNMGDAPVNDKSAILKSIRDEFHAVQICLKQESAHD